MKPFGSYIRGIREQQGLSLRSCADMLKIDKAYLSRLENSQVSPSIKFIKTFAKRLSSDTDKLFIASGRLPESFTIKVDDLPSLETLQLKEKSKRELKYVAIENDFPVDKVNTIAEMESWRKEVYRPIYHIHKWWAQRLGSVFRSIILGACLDDNEDLMKAYYNQNSFSSTIIYDPFMGSGTTIGEALKLGCRAIGRDINPVSYFITKTSLDVYRKDDIVKEFKKIEKDIADEIKYFYHTKLENGTLVDVLYYFWVKNIPCSHCDKDVDLFSSRIFSKHAYTKKHPEVRSICPNCGSINEEDNRKEKVSCTSCNEKYNQHKGNCRGQYAQCSSCNKSFKIIDAVQKGTSPPKHRMYAKLVMLPNGKKEYLPITDFDKELYEEAKKKLSKLIDHYPEVEIMPGYNTNQALNYNYSYWHKMFNERQLLVLGILAKRIKEIKDESIRNVFICLFSGCLEFNNMFCSFKGEGTGAVRHMFSHHILKPERTPLEANLWGTPKSSGSFSTLFKSRIIRTIDYKDNPFEIQPAVQKGKRVSKKIYNLNEKLYFNSVEDFDTFKNQNARLYLSCGNSAVTDIENNYVDFVITDPPFFDNVNYSELADFFYVWQRHFFLDSPLFKENTTRTSSEVQSQNVDTFTNNFMSVLLDAHRVLKDHGRLIFTYHHSKNDGWVSILVALHKAHFSIIKAYPVKSEMSVATPKSQAKEPIDIDVILVCKKITDQELTNNINDAIFEESINQTHQIIKKINGNKKRLSKNDIRVILMSNLISKLSFNNNLNESIKFFDEMQENIEESLNNSWEGQKYTTLSQFSS